MKKIKYLALASLVALGVTSCGDFGDVNINPEQLNEGNVPMQMVFTNAQHQALGSDWDVWRNGCIYLSQINQHVNAGGWWWSYALNSFSDGYASSYWDAVYSGGRGAVYHTQLALDKWEGDEAHANDYQAARVVRVYLFHRLTDLHGDIPYSQASKPAEFPYPEYDTQESIYTDMLDVLDKAYTSFKGNLEMGAADVYFQGDAAKWKKFTNSLMLRLAMRLVKVDEAKAKKYVALAASRDLILTNDDDAYLAHAGGSMDDDSSEPYAKIYSHADCGTGFISDVFMNYLKANNDPRVGLIGCVVSGSTDTGEAVVNKSWNNGAFSKGSCDPALQQGLPGPASFSATSGWFVGKIDTRFGVTDDAAAELDAFKGRTYTVNVEADANYYKKHFSTVNRNTYGDPEAPTFIITAAETNLLLAEAVVRGYISGNAETYYNNGVKAAIVQFQKFPNMTAQQKEWCTTAAAEAYLAANPYDAANAMEQINMQYWATTFCDEYESFANWRRSGIPAVKFNPAGLPQDRIDALGNAYTAGPIHRFPYSGGEATGNYENWNKAKARMGSVENEFDGVHVWWDK